MRRLLPNAASCANGDAAPLFTLPLIRKPSAAAAVGVAGRRRIVHDRRAAGRTGSPARAETLRGGAAAGAGALVAVGPFAGRGLWDPAGDAGSERTWLTEGAGGVCGRPAVISASGSIFNSHVDAGAPSAIVISCVAAAKPIISTRTRPETVGGTARAERRRPDR